MSDLLPGAAAEAIWQPHAADTGLPLLGGKKRGNSAASEADVHLKRIGCRIMTLIAALSTGCRLLVRVVCSTPPPAPAQPKVD